MKPSARNFLCDGDSSVTYEDMTTSALRNRIPKATNGKSIKDG